MDFTGQIDDYLVRLKTVIDNLSRDEINTLTSILIRAYERDSQIFIMGNGGSASTASHIACDINKGVTYGLEKRFRIISLNDSIPAMMAYANDVSYEDIFAEQLKNFINPDDVVIGFSGSGNSENVLRAVRYANEKKCITVGITGYKGGKLKQIAQYSVNANVEDMQLSEDIHLILGHILMRVLITKINPGAKY